MRYLDDVTAKALRSEADRAAVIAQGHVEHALALVRTSGSAEVANRARKLLAITGTVEHIARKSSTGIRILSIDGG